jgi:hypothetical protein
MEGGLLPRFVQVLAGPGSNVQAIGGVTHEWTQERTATGGTGSDRYFAGRPHPGGR